MRYVLWSMYTISKMTNCGSLQLAVFSFQQERLRRLALLVVAMDERGGEDVRIDDDAASARLARERCFHDFRHGAEQEPFASMP